jgi:surface antigen
MAVGSTPIAGAVGTTTRGALGHVVYVESVNGDGTINISEMNAPTFGKTTYRTASASEFVYIY